jgi:hypothetical protein
MRPVRLAAPRQRPGTGRQSEDEAEAEAEAEAITTPLAGLESQAGPGLAVDQLQGPAVENP